MCKHIAAVMYGIGARLDTSPELLFTLRGVDHQDLIAVDAEAALSTATTSGKSKQLATSDLSDVFGIDLASTDETPTGATDAPTTKKRRQPATKESATKKPVAMKATKRKTLTPKKPSTPKAADQSKGKTTRKVVKKK